MHILKARSCNVARIGSDTKDNSRKIHSGPGDTVCGREMRNSRVRRRRDKEIEMKRKRRRQSAWRHVVCWRIIRNITVRFHLDHVGPRGEEKREEREQSRGMGQWCCTRKHMNECDTCALALVPCSERTQCRVRCPTSTIHRGSNVKANMAQERAT